MTVVQSIARDSAGQPLKQLRVRIALVTGSSTLPGYTADGEIVGPGFATTDETGAWSADLVPNNLITPANTYYRVVEAAMVTTIVMPDSGGPYELRDVVSTPPPTPGTPGIAGVQLAVAGTVKGVRPEVNLIAGSGMTISGADNRDANRVDVTLSAAGGAGGVQLGTDLGGTDDAPEVISTHLTDPLPVDQGGTGHASAGAAFNALSPVSALGDLIYGSGASANSRLPGNTAQTKKFLAEIGDGTVSAAPTWAGIDLSDLPNQPWQFPVVNYGAKVDASQVSDGAMDLGSNILRCTTSLPFANGIVGKPIMVEGAGPPGVSTLVTTATSFTDSGHLVLADAASTAVSGATVTWASNDSAAVQAAVNDAVAYARAHHGYAQVIFPAGGCGNAAALSHADLGNGQVTLPVIPVAENTVTLEFRGAGTGNAIRHWEQTVPQMSGTCLISFGVYDSTGDQLADINANGQSALVCGPTGPHGYGDASFLFSNMNVVIKDLSILTTYSAQGLGYGAVWLWGCAQANLVDVGANTTAVFNNGAGELGSVSTLAGGASVGIGLPGTSNQNNVTMSRVTIGGGYTYGVLATEHSVFEGCHIFYCWAAVGAVGSWHDGGGVTANHSSHAIDLGQIGIEGCTHDVLILGNGASGIGPFLRGSIDVESGLSLADDGAGGLEAAVGELLVTGTTGGRITTSTGTRLTIIDLRSPIGVGSPWSLVVGTPLPNPQWRWATVILSGGSGLTDIELGDLRGGASAPTMTNIYSQAAGALPPITVRVPPGGWLSVIGAGSPTAPTATVVYE